MAKRANRRYHLISNQPNLLAPDVAPAAIFILSYPRLL